jgi:hypothetical protein
MIIDKFAAAGFGKLQQAAAVANAIAESSLDAGQITRSSREESVGLFQINRFGPPGSNFTIAALQDPGRNISVIIGKIGKGSVFRDFSAAQTLADAVGIFVDKVEIPANRAKEKANRLAIAQKLMRA